MRKLLCLILVAVITFSFVPAQKAHAEIPVRAKAFLTISAYGAGAGALLGAASMAFGTSSRAVAQGASLGLYAGILFGTYVLVSHHQKRAGYYDDNSLYQNSSDIYGDDYRSDEGGGGQGAGSNFFNRFETLQQKFSTHEKGGQMPPLYMNLLSLQF